MTASVSKQRVFAPTIATGAQVTKQRVFVPIYDTALTPATSTWKPRVIMVMGG